MKKLFTQFTHVLRGIHTTLIKQGLTMVKSLSNKLKIKIIYTLPKLVFTIFKLIELLHNISFLLHRLVKQIIKLVNLIKLRIEGLKNLIISILLLCNKEIRLLSIILSFFGYYLLGISAAGIIYQLQLDRIYVETMNEFITLYQILEYFSLRLSVLNHFTFYFCELSDFYIALPLMDFNTDLNDILINLIQFNWFFKFRKVVNRDSDASFHCRGEHNVDERLSTEYESINKAKDIHRSFRVDDKGRKIYTDLHNNVSLSGTQDEHTIKRGGYELLKAYTKNRGELDSIGRENREKYGLENFTVKDQLLGVERKSIYSKILGRWVNIDKDLPSLPERKQVTFTDDCRGGSISNRLEYRDPRNIEISKESTGQSKV
jgi:hypothetical protein